MLISPLPFDECFICECHIVNEYPEHRTYYNNITDMGAWQDGKRRQYDCKACGRYSLHGFKHIKSFLSDKDIPIKVRHYLAAHKIQGEKSPPMQKLIELTDSMLPSIMKCPLLSPPEQVDNMVRFLANSKMARDYQIIMYRIHGGIIGSNSRADFRHVFHDLIDNKFIHYSKLRDSIRLLDGPEADISLAVEGWRYCQQLQKGKTSNNKGFMAMKFENEELSEILEGRFKPAVKKAGFELTTLKDEHKAGLIDDQMIIAIQNADFVIADLTDENRGAYFEAGYAIGLGKPVIFTCEKSKWESDKTHFDVNHYRTIIWDPGNPSEAAEDIKLAIRATFPEKAKMSDDEE